MKIHSDVLTERDIRDELPSGVRADIELRGSRKRAHGFIVYLSGSSPRQRQHDHMPAATWDEHGIWMAGLFEIDDCAIVGYYDGRQDFYEKTQSYQPKGATAPWLGHTRWIREAAYIQKKHRRIENLIYRQVTTNGIPFVGAAYDAVETALSDMDLRIPDILPTTETNDGVMLGPLRDARKGVLRTALHNYFTSRKPHPDLFKELLTA